MLSAKLAAACLSSPFHTETLQFAITAVCQFSTIVCSHRAKQLQRKDKLLYKSHRKPALWLLKRRDGVHHDDDGVFSRCFPGVLLLI